MPPSLYPKTWPREPKELLLWEIHWANFKLLQSQFHQTVPETLILPDRKGKHVSFRRRWNWNWRWIGLLTLLILVKLPTTRGQKSRKRKTWLMFQTNFMKNLLTYCFRASSSTFQKGLGTAAAWQLTEQETFLYQNCIDLVLITFWRKGLHI